MMRAMMTMAQRKDHYVVMNHPERHGIVTGVKEKYLK